MLKLMGRAPRSAWAFWFWGLSSPASLTTLSHEIILFFFQSEDEGLALLSFTSGFYRLLRFFFSAVF